MASSVITSDNKPPRRGLRADWARRLLNELLVLFIALLGLLAAGLVLLDTAPGHRFIINKIAGIETASGLRIRIGRIDGSLFGQSQLRNVRVSDTKGVFFTSPNIKVDWSPAAWLDNRLRVDSLTAQRATLSRLPSTRPSASKGPLLPHFDIHIGELRIDRLDIGPAVSGRARSGSVHGKADIRSGRALVELGAMLNDGGDRIAFRLDTEPARDTFDIDARVIAPADGLVPALIGVKRPLSLAVAGKGSWTRWRGGAAANIDGRPVLRLGLGVDRGHYRLQGKIGPAQFLSERMRALAGPVVAVRGDATFSGGLLDGQLSASSPAIRAVARGGIDLSASRYRQLRVGIDLLRPKALYPTMSGDKVRMVWTLNGAMASADYSYRLTSRFVKIDANSFAGLRAEGRGTLGPWPMRVPIRLSATAISGLGDVAGSMLANPRVEGWLSLSPRFIRGDGLRLSSARWNGKLSFLVDLASGRFDLTLSGAMKRYLVPGLGIVDVMTDLHIVPGPGGKGSRVVGTGKVWVRRLDNGFLAGLTRGLPRIEAAIERGPDGILRFTRIDLYSPGLRLTGSGQRNLDGTFHIVASGRQADYGPVRLVLDGNIASPRIDLLLASPNQAMGIRDLHLSLVPVATGFDYRASGQSKLGPFTSVGRILLPARGAPVIAIASLDAGGAHASGDLRIEPGGVAGRLALSGSLGGTLDFAPVAGAQRIDAHLAVLNAGFADLLTVRNGRVDATIVLGDHTTIDGTLDARGVQAGQIALARISANARLIDGSGQVRVVASGSRGADFGFSAVADVTPDRISISGSGTVRRRPLVLRQAAVLTRSGDGWALAPTAITFAGGNATLSGRSGADPEIHAELRAMPLDVLDIGWPGLGLSGSATGRVDYAWKGHRNGHLDLKVRGLSRAGMVLASKPIDLAVAAVIDDRRAGLRAVAASDGAIVGRAQARFAPMGNGPLAAELMRAPLFAQLRYSGPADALWRLTGSEVLDLSGPLAVGADVGGTLASPVIRGVLRTRNARLESPVTGMVLSGVATEARFSGPQLIFSKISAQTSGGGTVSGNGSVTFAGGKPLLNLAFTANQALLLNRDDIAARVTGPLRIRSDSNGGTISGKLALVKGRFQLGQASSAAAVPMLKVRDRNLDPSEVIETADLHPWKLDLDVTGSDLQVIGLGIDSRWTTNIHVGGFADEPRFTGRADLVRGDYNFAGRSFRLDRGIIRLQGESPPDPRLDIHATAQLQGLDASVIVGGTGQKPEITFASTPALPPDELLSRILFGTSITNLSAPEALQLASAIGALRSGSGGLDPINALRKAVGLDRLRIVPADIATGQKTAIAAGKYITRKLFVEVVTDGQGYSATRVEYQMTRWLSLLSTISTVGRSSAAVRVSKDY
ncbi:MAG: translocation/assembly module TamB domain-containing protein [Sphingomicrobium sp.]